jgi:hypothetical protein
MALYVSSAFNEFQKDKVNLDSQKTKDARGSKDWLIEQIHKFPDNDSDFPKLYHDIDIQFGSFARRTKIRPLDDIDLMIGIWGETGASYATYYDRIEIYGVPHCLDSFFLSLRCIILVKYFINSYKFLLVFYNLKPDDFFHCYKS